MPSPIERPHIVVLHRWRESYALYDQYIDHAANAVTYVSSDVGPAAIPAGAADQEIVADIEDEDLVVAAVKALIARWGEPSGVIALKEDDLLVAAQLRERFGLPGPSHTQLIAFRDKAVMIERVAAAGLCVPRSARASSRSEMIGFAAKVGWPIVVKPRLGSSSEGVRIVDSVDDLPDPAGRSLIVQEFIGHPIHHVDGVFDGSRIRLARVSAYTNDCVAFRDGVPLASAEVDDAALCDSVIEQAERFLLALGNQPTVFHLEVFVHLETRESIFLEVGARVGGAEIPLVWREVHGTDLMGIASALQLGHGLPELPEQSIPEAGTTAGWLLLPAPAARPCRITRSASMLELDPGPYAEHVLPAGALLPDAKAYYEHVGGRFRFAASSRVEVEAAIQNTIRHFRVEATPVDAQSPGSSAEAAATVAPTPVGANR